MNDTLPPNLSAWLGPAAPGCCLANKSPARQSSEKLQSALETELKKRLTGRGSMIYRIAWKEHVTPLGRSISRQRASTPRTSDSAPILGQLIRSGWATAAARGWKDTAGMAETSLNPDGSTRNRMDQLGRQVQLSGWPTVRAADGEKNVRTMGGALREIARKGSPQDMAQAAAISGWPSPTVGNSAGSQSMANMSPTGRRADGSKGTVSLPGIAKLTGPTRLTASGQILTGCSAGMESGGQLNPEHSRWLMGFPVAWGSCGATAMQSIRNRPRSSSKRSAMSPSQQVLYRMCGVVDRQLVESALETLKQRHGGMGYLATRAALALFLDPTYKPGIDRTRQ